MVELAYTSGLSPDAAWIMGSTPIVSTSASEMSYSRLASKKTGLLRCQQPPRRLREDKKCWACAAVENWHIDLTQNQRFAGSTPACSTITQLVMSTVFAVRSNYLSAVFDENQSDAYDVLRTLGLARLLKMVKRCDC